VENLGNHIAQAG